MNRKSIVRSIVVGLVVAICATGAPVGSVAAALPEGWQSLDIGTTGGSAAEIEGIWAISADGADIWWKSDEFHYAFVPLSGNGTIVARVLDNGAGSDTWAKGGVMIRETLEPDSKHAMMLLTGGSGDGKAFQYRPIAGQRSMSAHGGDPIAPPMWVKLTRVGNTFTGYYSTDGYTWEQQPGISLDPGPVASNPATIVMAKDVYVGLFVTSHRSGEIRTYTFDNVSVIRRVDVTSPRDFVQGVPNDGDWPSEYYRPEIPDMAIDDNIETKYLHFKGDFEPDPGTGGAGFQVTPWAGATIVTGLTFTTANDFPGRDPIAFELSGSNVGIDGPYELIASGDIIDFDQALAWPRFTMNITPISFMNYTAYAHYQLIFTAIRGPAGGSVNSMQIAEVELLGVPAPADADIIPVTEATEDFETNDFGYFSWNSYGDESWETTGSEMHSGFFSARSGSIEDGESTTLEVSLDCVSGYITFYRKVYSESYFDYLMFKIDGVEKESWSGEEDWSEVSFAVDEGTRTFEWTYSKDSSVSEGDDTAWIDDIVFPIGP